MEIRLHAFLTCGTSWRQMDSTVPVNDLKVAELIGGWGVDPSGTRWGLGKDFWPRR
jgi:hypothetical protein